MTQLLAFSGSLSSDSINHKLIEYTASTISYKEVQIVKLSDFDIPLYSKDIETGTGIPEGALELRKYFDDADAFMVSVPEYNSSIPAGFKNAMDWLSRMEGKVFQDKPVLLMSASPGGRGGASVLQHLSGIIPFWGAELVGTFSLPRFGDNFQDGKIQNKDLAASLEIEIEKLVVRLEQA